MLQTLSHGNSYHGQLVASRHADLGQAREARHISQPGPAHTMEFVCTPAPSSQIGNEHSHAIRRLGGARRGRAIGMHMEVSPVSPVIVSTLARTVIVFVC